MQWMGNKLCWAWCLQSPSGCSWQDAPPKAILTFLAGKCPGCFLELLWVTWFRDIISSHWQKSTIHFRTQKVLRDSGGRSREWRAPLVQVWGFTRFPDLACVWSTCGYCSLCDYHSEPGTTVPQRTQLEFFREIPLSQWKKKKKDSAASVHGNLEFWGPQRGWMPLPYERYMLLLRYLWWDILKLLYL